ncbi:hypothetical protein [Acinetobacter gerneri]|uniref:hypothetical protein n=1 Tax=Acinetobacter gerneri TaxID=202952 RepID=UPI0028B193A9|nr:hypothetical protein [Acinetobacter gerneri]
MKANEFVKKFGLEEASEIVAGVPERFMSCYYSSVCWDTNTYKYSDRFKPRESLVNIGWLKRLVESHELVKHIGGLEKSKFEYESLLKFRNFNYERLKQAIADVESCGESK